MIFSLINEVIWLNLNTETAADGLFLERVEIFDRDGKQEIALPLETLTVDLAKFFEMDAGLITSALKILKNS